MRGVRVLFCYLILAGSVSAQNIESLLMAGDRSAYNEIMSALQRKDFIEAIIGLNSFIPGYSSYGDLYFIRGVARMQLNDVEGARKDFILAKASGYKEENINFFISKEYLVSRLLKDLKMEIKLDSLREYRPVIESRDTIQGALRPERTCFDVYFYNLTVKILIYQTF